MNVTDRVSRCSIVHGLFWIKIFKKIFSRSRCRLTACSDFTEAIFCSSTHISSSVRSYITIYLGNLVSSMPSICCTIWFDLLYSVDHRIYISLGSYISFRIWSLRVQTLLLLKNFISLVCTLRFHFSSSSKFSFHELKQTLPLNFIILPSRLS